MKRLSVALLSVALLWAAVLLAACDRERGPNSQSVLAQTAANLGDIRSGDLDLRVVARTGRDGDEGGFSVKGVFDLRVSPGQLPKAQLTYSRIGGNDEGDEVEFTSTGRRAFVTIGATTYRLPQAQERQLRVSRATSEGGGGLERLDLTDWIRNPELDRGGPTSGTDKITADLDAVAALNDLFALAREFGARDVGRGRITGDDAERVRRAVRSARLRVDTGKDDRLLRRLDIELEFRLRDQPRLERALGRYAAAHLELHLSIDDPNLRFEVAEPDDARPSGELNRAGD